MKKLIFVFFIVFSSNVYNIYADTYAVERPDGGVSIIYYNEGASDSLESVINDLGFKGFPIKKVDVSDLPPDRSNRKYWKLNDIPVGKKIIIDSVKKQVDLDAQAQKEIEKDAVFTKLKISRAEFEKIK